MRGRWRATWRPSLNILAPIGSWCRSRFTGSRLWRRGFNQSVLVARELSRRLDVRSDVLVLRRSRRTPPLKGMSALQRRKAVAGAFTVTNKAAVAGKTVILVDDVLTTGSTAEACARTLKRAGAARVELVTWARVVRPTQLMR